MVSPERTHITFKIVTKGSNANDLPCGCQNYTMLLHIRTRYFGVSLAQSITQAENAIYFVNTYVAYVEVTSLQCLPQSL